MKYSAYLLSAAAFFGASLATDDRRHFYSTDSNGEGMGAQGYTLKGIVAYVWSTQVGSSVPIFRCHNEPSDNSGTLWLYTDSIQCENAPGYSADGIAFYILPAQQQGVTELSRYHQSNGDTWLVRANKASLRADFASYSYEAPLGYFFDGQGPRNQPLYAFSKGQDA